MGLETGNSSLNVTICPNEFFSYNGALLPPDTTAVFVLTGSAACDSVVTVQVNAWPTLQLSLPMDTTIRIGDEVLLEATVSGAGPFDYAWSPPEGLSCVDCSSPVAAPFDTINYQLLVTDTYGCSADQSVTVRVNDECRVRIPNAFSPNGDGANDRFQPISDPCVGAVRVWRIVNRWGETVWTRMNFDPESAELGWDGMWNGRPHPSEVLVWMLEIEYKDGRRETRSGEVTLLR
jgi:gliding motility-associated-like protein